MFLWRIPTKCATKTLFMWHMDDRAPLKYYISVAHGLVHHKIAILVAWILWRSAHAPRKSFFGALYVNDLDFFCMIQRFS
jgi:hypothetical protein